MNFYKTIFLVLILSLLFTATNYAQAYNTPLLNKNTQIDITSDDSEEEIYNFATDLTCIKSQHNIILHQQQRKKTIVKKIFYVLFIAGGATVALFLYFKLTDYCYMQEENC